MMPDSSVDDTVAGDGAGEHSHQDLVLEHLSRQSRSLLQGVSVGSGDFAQSKNENVESPDESPGLERLSRKLPPELEDKSAVIAEDTKNPAAQPPYTMDEDDALIYTQRRHSNLPHPPWTKDEDEALISARHRHSNLTWDQMVALVPGNRSTRACCNRYHRLISMKKLSPRERCRGRPRKTSKPESQVQIYSRPISDIPWTTKENDTLRRAKAKCLAWGEISKSLPGRSWRECKLQYEKLLNTTKKARLRFFSYLQSMSKYSY
jgi:hypothetical protein